MALSSLEQRNLNWLLKQLMSEHGYTDEALVTDVGTLIATGGVDPQLVNTNDGSFGVNVTSALMLVHGASGAGNLLLNDGLYEGQQVRVSLITQDEGFGGFYLYSFTESFANSDGLDVPALTNAPYAQPMVADLVWTSGIWQPVSFTDGISYD